MDSIINSSWIQGTALGILILGGSLIIRFLAKELKLWQEKYLALVKETAGQQQAQYNTLELLNEAVDDLARAMDENKTLQMQVLQRLESVMSNLDVKKLIEEIGRTSTRGTRR